MEREDKSSMPFVHTFLHLAMTVIVAQLQSRSVVSDRRARERAKRSGGGE